MICSYLLDHHQSTRHILACGRSFGQTSNIRIERSRKLKIMKDSTCSHKHLEILDMQCREIDEVVGSNNSDNDSGARWKRQNNLAAIHHDIWSSQTGISSWYHEAFQEQT